MPFAWILRVPRPHLAEKDSIRIRMLRDVRAESARERLSECAIRIGSNSVRGAARERCARIWAHRGSGDHIPTHRNIRIRNERTLPANCWQVRTHLIAD